MSQIEIHLADECDSDALCALCYEFHEYHVRGVPSRLRSLGDRDEQDWSRLHKLLSDIYRNGNAALFVAQVAGEMVGLAEVYYKQDDRANPAIVPYSYGYLQSLMVLEPFRRQGIGMQLVNVAKHWAKEKGATEMRLSVWEFDAGPLPFYERIGFRTLQRELVAKLD